MDYAKQLKLALIAANISFETDPGEKVISTGPDRIVVRKGNLALEVSCTNIGSYGVSIFRKDDPPVGFDGADVVWHDVDRVVFGIKNILDIP